MRFLTRLPRRYIAVFGFYLVVTLIVTFPGITTLSTHFLGHETGDSIEMARHIWWFGHALRTGQDLFYQPLMAYPDGLSGILLWAHPLQFFPAWLFGLFLPLALAFNLMMMLSLALNGWAMYWLMCHLLKREDAPPLIAGLIFMIFPTVQGHLFAGHTSLMVQWPVPLYIYALLRLIDSPSRRYFGLAVLFFVASVAGHGIQFIHMQIPLTGVFIVVLLWRREWGKAGRVLSVAIVGSLIMLIFLVPLAIEAVNTPALSDDSGSVTYSLDLLAIVTPSFGNPVFDSLLHYPRQVLGTNLVEGSAYLGILSTILAGIGLWKWREARWWLLLAVVAWIFALGSLLKVFDTPLMLERGTYQTSVTLPWAAFSDLPFFSLARSPGRFAFALGLALAVMAGYGMAAVIANQQRNRRWLIAGVLMAGIIFEYQIYWPFPTVSAEIPARIADIAHRDDVRAVFNVPTGNPLATKQAMYLQTAHERPIIGGQMTRQTPVNPAVLNLLEGTLNPGLLDVAGVDVVIVHRQYADEVLINRAQGQLGDPVYADQRFIIFTVPDADESPIVNQLLYDDTTTNAIASSYFYAADSGWWQFSGTIAADGRDVILLLDNQPLHRWQVDGETLFSISIPITEAGFYSITLALDPPCPQHIHPTLSCRALAIDNLQLEQVTDTAFAAPVAFDGGITLMGSDRAIEGDNLVTRLWWRFDEARTEDDVRFVHVVDAEGVLVAQEDIPRLDAIADDSLAEQVVLAIGDLPPGDYRVFTGWYVYPEIVNYCVLVDGGCGADMAVEIGTFVIESE